MYQVYLLVLRNRDKVDSGKTSHPSGKKIPQVWMEDTGRLAGRANQSGVSDRKRGRKAANRGACGVVPQMVIGGRARGCLTFTSLFHGCFLSHSHGDLILVV